MNTPQSQNPDDHSEKFLEMVRKTDRYGTLEYPDGYGKRKGDCGDTIEMFLSIRGAQIQMVTFTVEGCSNTVACSNTVSYLVEGRSITDGWELNPKDIINYLETLSKDHHHCAELAVGTFYNALADYNKRTKESWKNNYPHKK